VEHLQPINDLRFQTIPEHDDEPIHHYIPALAPGPAVGEVPDIQKKHFDDGFVIRKHFARGDILAHLRVQAFDGIGSVDQLATGSFSSFRQTTSYGQLFWAARKWLVPSLIVERLRVDRPYRESLDAAKVELAARLSSQVTVTAGPRIQRDEVSGRIARSVVFQLALKTVH
jgi:hypothetical protein